MASSRLIVLIIALAIVGVAPLLPANLVGSWHDFGRLMQLWLMPLATLTFWRHPPCRPSRNAAFLVLAVPSLTIASVMTSSRPDLALREVFLMVGLVTICCALVVTMNSQLLERGLIAGTAFYAVIQLAVMTSSMFLRQPINYWYYFFGYENPRFLNHVHSVAAPLLAAFSFDRQLPKRWRACAILALVYCLFTTQALSARATTIAMLGAGFAAPVLFGRTGLLLAKRMLLSAIAGGLMYLLLMRGLPAILDIEAPAAFRDPSDMSSVEARFQLWHVAWSQIVTHPWLGVGPMHFSHQASGDAAHPHNVYLQTAAEYGLPLFATLIAFVACGLWRARQLICLTRPDDVLAVGSYLACLGAMLDGCFSGNFVMPMVQLWIVLAASLLVSQLQLPVRISGTCSHKIWRGALIALLAAQGWLLYVSVPEWLSGNAVLRGRSPASDDAFYPRYWRNGRF